MTTNTVQKDEVEEKLKDEKVAPKGKFYLTLRKDETEKDIEVLVPDNIRMGIVQTFISLRYGLPPLDVSPIDWRGLFHIIGAFLAVLLCASLNDNPFFIALGLGLLAYNFYITQNYFRHFIRRKLREGYVIDNEDHLKIVVTANAVPSTEEENKKIKLKTKVIIGILLILSIFFLTQGGSSIDVIKDSQLEYDDTITIEKAFETHSSFRSNSWSSFETDRGREVVEFRGTLDFEEFVGDTQMYDNGELEVVAQFTFNADKDSFSVTYGGLEGWVSSGDEVEDYELSLDIENFLGLIYEDYLFTQSNLNLLFYSSLLN